jgi:hypothetical protein
VVFNINLNKQERLKYLYFAISPLVANNISDTGEYADGDLINDIADGVKTNGSYATSNFPLAVQSVYYNMLFRACTLFQINFGGHTFTLNQ